MSDFESEHMDMSPEAIARRLRLVSDLLELCLSLQKAKLVGLARDLEVTSDREPGDR